MSKEPLQLYPYLVSRLGQARILVVDGESAESVRDYEPLIRDLLSLATIPLELERFDCTESDPRVLQPTVSGITLTFMVEGDTDWIDSETLVSGLNEILIRSGLDYRFYAFYDAAQFSQETGFCFMEKTTGETLLEELRLNAESEEGYFGFFTNGADSVGLENDEFDEEDEEWDDEEDWDEEWEEDEDDDDEEEEEDDDGDDDEEDYDEEEGDEDEDEDDWDADEEDWEEDDEYEDEEEEDAPRKPQ